MRFLVGDDTGILKWVRVEAQKVQRLGASRRGDACERLCWAGSPFEREARVAVGYASGAIEVRDADSGEVEGAFELKTPGIRCLQVLPSSDDGGRLLAVSAGGHAGIVSGWCEEERPVALDDKDARPDGVRALARFELPGPVADAKICPARPDRMIFGGGENDVKLWDLARGEVAWRAKNVREDSLCLRVPVKVSCLHWASELAPSRDGLVLCGTGDGKVRLYDVNAQRRPLFEFVVGYGAGAGTGGYTGTMDECARPLNCGAVASVRGDASWSLFVGNTMGVLREYDLRNLSSCQSAPVPPGRKAHLKWAAKQLPFRRGYRGITGSIRDVDVHCSGEALVAVGLGRFAYVFETRKKRMTSKVYLKQKLCSVLMSAEEYKTKEDSEAEGDEEEGEDAAGNGAVGEGSDDEVVEGFSTDEEAADEPGAGEGGEEENDDASEAEEDSEADDDDEEAPPRRKKKTVARQQTTVIRPDDEKPARKRKRSRQKVPATAAPDVEKGVAAAPRRRRRVRGGSGGD